ncbi:MULTISPECIES: AHH domain-containing protein [unclassified Sphingopyxis]|uniref:AHH domain-containing protein n=1 Tax=unclassified Sphingopyxis TaxID=2614943 RepID=UPI000731E1D6|nr:hypothetical protein ATE78_02215 [Sphingopyxis sp. H012]KTE13323.1 hypothetical protein ATE70_01210 [Sphingopyxis sp. H053]KTE14510.1 hypothetical protein ATE76_08770 [Sphingopyxis sp. H093]KTE31162.1 hypothetical protein ATE75_01185 [Sphingopyxis sp. H080]KTE42547.1 hypothetical protein ATE73_13700 [Sphingopyxis sp. H077]KTE46994.1 hypothetical protein ATE77_01210 [Sphingopyxis sp. H005]KTE71415.1 hypothetical protein ATE74_01210 [Sphingopyxis sp. H085]
MPPRGWQGAPPPQSGFQRHHLIPIALTQRPQMAAMFEQLHAEGFALQHFGRNGLMLPACEPVALRSGHALHRGPHHGYSDVIAARVERIRAHFALHAPAIREWHGAPPSCACVCCRTRRAAP